MTEFEVVKKPGMRSSHPFLSYPMLRRTTRDSIGLVRLDMGDPHLLSLLLCCHVSYSDVSYSDVWGESKMSELIGGSLCQHDAFVDFFCIITLYFCYGGSGQVGELTIAVRKQEEKRWASLVFLKNNLCLYIFLTYLMSRVMIHLFKSCCDVIDAR